MASRVAHVAHQPAYYVVGNGGITMRVNEQIYSLNSKRYGNQEN